MDLHGCPKDMAGKQRFHFMLSMARLARRLAHAFQTAGWYRRGAGRNEMSSTDSMWKTVDAELDTLDSGLVVTFVRRGFHSDKSSCICSSIWPSSLS